MRDVAGHPRRFPQDDVERNVDRTIAEPRVIDDELALRIRAPHHRERAALALAHRAKVIQSLQWNREHVALLRLVAPDLARRHARLFGGNRAQIERPTDTASLH